ncbi:protein-disulfide reductase DsbD family protein [Gemmatimonadota bacterium]
MSYSAKRRNIRTAGLRISLAVLAIAAIHLSGIIPAFGDTLASPAAEITAIQAGPEQIEIDPQTEGGLVDFNLARDKGLFWMYLAAFLGGILASLTPCVLPIIPLTITVIGARSASNRAKGFSLSLVYVLGIAVMYSTLGVVAASTGALFGSLFQSRLFLALAIALFTLLAFGLFGAYELQLPAGIRNRLMSKQGQGWFGVFIMGIVAGLVASPCVGPIIVGILAFIAQTGSAMFGFTLLFTFSMGMGLLFLVVGTFSGEIKKMPSGSWMTAVENFLGVLMMAVSFYYLSILLEPFAFALVLGATLVIGGTFTGAFLQLTGEQANWYAKARKAVGILLVASGLYFFVGALMTSGTFLPAMSRVGMSGGASGEEAGGGLTSAEAGLEWGDDVEAALILSEIEGKPVMIDFTADWCVACKELDHFTFSDPAVVEVLKEFILVRVDLTNNDDPKNQEYYPRYEIYGLPSVTFITPSGELLRDQKVVGFVKADRFLEILNAVLEVSKILD